MAKLEFRRCPRINPLLQLGLGDDPPRDDGGHRNIDKGKAQARYEFGCKVSLATTNATAPGGQFILGARALPGTPYDGHTLAAQIAQTKRLIGIDIERAMSTAATAATTPTGPACSSLARSVASRPPFAATGDAAAPSNLSSTT
jgi:hypothetical protein